MKVSLRLREDFHTLSSNPLFPVPPVRLEINGSRASEVGFQVGVHTRLDRWSPNLPKVTELPSRSGNERDGLKTTSDCVPR